MKYILMYIVKYLGKSKIKKIRNVRKIFLL